MMNRFVNLLFLLSALVSHIASAVGTSEPALNPHNLPVREHKAQCLSCHTELRKTAATSNGVVVPLFVGDGIRACITCHESAAVKHMVGKRPNFPVPGDLPLDEQDRITCLTCHYTHGSLRSDKPWVDVSWFERLSNSERLHKTFLLRRNNRDGELCMACHDS